MFLIFVFRQDNQPCDIMEQTQTDTICCVSNNVCVALYSGSKYVLIFFQTSLLNLDLIELQTQKSDCGPVKTFVKV